MFVVISASPNQDGLTAACVNAVLEGIKAGGGEAVHFDISASKLQSCKVCHDGWGDCQTDSRCVIRDNLAELQDKIREAEGVTLVTPVYWGQPSERMKYFLDRFRRCEAFNQVNGSAAKGKQIDLIAAAGGSGHGTVTALEEMQMWCQHVGATPKDRIGITNFNREPMLEAIKDASRRLANGQYFKGF